MGGIYFAVSFLLCVGHVLRHIVRAVFFAVRGTLRLKTLVPLGLWHAVGARRLSDERSVVLCRGCGKVFGGTSYVQIQSRVLGNAPQLHIFELDTGGDTDWFAAFDFADAAAVVADYIRDVVGESFDDYCPGGLALTRCDDIAVARFHHREELRRFVSRVGDGVHLFCSDHEGCVIEVRSYSEHARLNGRGLWASTVY